MPNAVNAVNAVIAGYARTPFHFAKKGGLTQVRPDDLAAVAVHGLVERTGVNPQDIEDVILGCAYPEAEQGNNMARIVACSRGCRIEVAGMTVNRFCGSSMSAIHIAAGADRAGGRGVPVRRRRVDEHACRRAASTSRRTPRCMETHAHAYISMGETAENVADAMAGHLARDQEQLAVESHRKAAAARERAA